MRSVVDLPQPEGPTRTMNSWSAMSRVELLDRHDALVGHLEVCLLLLGTGASPFLCFLGFFWSPLWG